MNFLISHIGSFRDIENQCECSVHTSSYPFLVQHRKELYVLESIYLLKFLIERDLSYIVTINSYISGLQDILQMNSNLHICICQKVISRMCFFILRSTSCINPKDGDTYKFMLMVVLQIEFISPWFSSPNISL